MPRRATRRGILPGFGLSMGITLLFVSLVVLVPLSTIVLKTSEIGWSKFWTVVTADRAIAAYKVTFGTSFYAALANVFFGLVVAWTLVRYRFFGRGFLDALIDLPFAVPTAVSGIALTALYSHKGWAGELVAPFGIKIAFTQLGITLALTFVTLPFVIRTVQPVLEEIDADAEESAALLGANRWTTFTRIILPNLVPPLLTGFALAFARAIGEYGSVVFISGNMPGKTEIAPLLIMTKLEQFDYAGATSIALVMLLVSFALLLTVNRLQAWTRTRTGQAA
jgi:sulfate transport system permease protein